MTKYLKSAERLAAHLKRCGADVSVDRSYISKSAYIHASTDEASIKIRGSDHAARPTYEALNGAADLEFGPHDMTNGHPSDCLAPALALLGLEPDAIARRVIGACRTRDARAQAKRAEREAEEAAYRLRAAQQRDAFEKWAGERLDEANSRPSAKARKKARRKLRDLYAAEMGRPETGASGHLLA